MKCPLREVHMQIAIDKWDWVSANCLEEECAWWEGPNIGCSLLLLSLRLGTICEVLTELESKMPH